MSGADTRMQKVKRYFDSLPGKRGRDVPESVYDAIYPVANGITQSVWGRRPTPQQMQYLHDAGLHTPQQVHAAYSDLPHPHAPNVTLGQYPDYAHAAQVYHEHRR